MALWNLWRGEATEEPSWGRSPALRVGETVRLQVTDGVNVGVHRAQVRAIGLRRIFLDTEGNVPRGSLTLSYARGEALYQFGTRPVGPSRAGTMAVAFPRQVVRLQRRQFYRLPLESPTTLRLLSPDGRVNSAPVPARLVNLSGGGAQLAIQRQPIPMGVEVVVRVPSGRDGEAISVDALTLDCRVATRGASQAYLVRVRFYEHPRFPEEDREAVIAYLHEQQRLMLRARKLLRA